MQFILASGSRYRQSLLQKLCIPFTAMSPNIDESPYPDESAEQLVLRLAEQKAKAIAKQFPTAWVIASDQVACYQQQILGKPHSEQKAKEQLRQFSGNKVRFLTSLCIYNAQSNQLATKLETFDVEFRELSDNLITRYIQLEQPLDCAGSFKSEGLGILLFDSLNGRDPNTLIGLPLILLRELFQRFDIELLNYSK